MGLATLAGYWRSLRVDSTPVCVNSTAAPGAVVALLRTRNSLLMVGRLFRGTPAEEERLIIEANRQRVKTPEQKAREFKELKRIEKALAKERRESGNNQHGVPVKLPEGSKGDARDKAAKQIGMSGLTDTKAA